FPIGTAGNADSGYGKAAPSARYAGQFAFVGADDCPASDFIMDLRVLAVRERVVDGEVSVGKGGHVGINKLLVAVDSAGHGGGTGVVVNVVGGHQIVDSTEVLAVPNIFENPAGERCILCGHWGPPHFGRILHPQEDF